MTPQFSIIVPVFNRPQEVEELLSSLSQQTFGDFEVVIVEDGSDQDCAQVADGYSQSMQLNYFSKPNTGPGDSRNFGMARAKGEYFIFFDSDCLIPEDYLQRVHDALQKRPLQAFGGPDEAHPDFSITQKAINYAMTSLLTTGGIRGRTQQLDKFQPRSFNMGVHRKVFETVGGFSNLHPGEDPDWSYRIQDAGFKTGLIADAFVYHKRRIDFNKFWKQVYKFGLARTILMKLHPHSRKLVYALPTIAFCGGIVWLFAGVFQPYLWWPLLAALILILAHAWYVTGSLLVAMWGVWATLVQISAYGWGFLKGYWYLHILGREPQQAFPDMFFIR